MSSQSYFFNPQDDRMSCAGSGLQLPRLSSTQRLALTVGVNDAGLQVFDITANSIYVWDGTAWTQVSGGGGGTLPEVIPVLGSNGTTALSIWSVNFPFTFPTPVIPTGRTIYSGMRITFSDIVTGDYTVGPTANPVGNYEIPLIHGGGIGRATPDPFFFSTRNNLTCPDDPAGTSFTTTVSMSGSMIIPAQQFTPDGITALTFFDDSAGLGFMAPTVQNGGSFGINMATSLLLPGIYILAEYIYA